MTGLIATQLNCGGHFATTVRYNVDHDCICAHYVVSIKHIIALVVETFLFCGSYNFPFVFVTPVTIFFAVSEQHVRALFS